LRECAGERRRSSAGRLGSRMPYAGGSARPDERSQLRHRYWWRVKLVRARPQLAAPADVSRRHPSRPTSVQAPHCGLTQGAGCAYCHSPNARLRVAARSFGAVSDRSCRPVAAGALFALEPPDPNRLRHGSLCSVISPARIRIHVHGSEARRSEERLSCARQEPLVLSA